MAEQKMKPNETAFTLYIPAGVERFPKLSIVTCPLAAL